MERVYKNCQSCGMPLNRDQNGGGTNADGSKNVMYCSYCYQGDKFTMTDITVNEMKERVKVKLKEFRFPGFLTGIFTKNIPKLERWKTHAG